MSALEPPPPRADGARPGLGDLLAELHERLGHEDYVATCADLLSGGSRAEHAAVLPWLTGLAPEDTGDPARWPEPWLRVWGARGLLHHWDDTATDVVVGGLADPAWRVAEGCLRVAARHDAAGAGPGAAALLVHDLSRVRVAALRALAVAGDTEHVAAVAAALDDPAPDVRRQAERARTALADRLDLAP